jgi:DNA-binding response OmpR family regulator
MMSKIVVIDDSQADLKLIEEYLKSAHHTVVSFSDAMDLEDKLVKEKPDVVVMDIVMPGRSGFQACRDLKSDERYKNIPVILCSSKRQESDKFWGEQQGANTYLVKPVKAEALLDAIKDVLRQR